MKKHILTGVAVALIVLILVLFSILYSRYNQPSPPTLPSCDAIVLTNSKKSSDSMQYDLRLDGKSSPSSQYAPHPSKDSASFFYQNSLTPLISRTLSLSNESFCHYGLFEKDEKAFAFFRCDINSDADAQRLCHLLLCYRDYFPMLILGNFTEEAKALVQSVCQMNTATVDGMLAMTANLKSEIHSKSGTLLLNFEPTEKTLDLSKKMIALTYDDGPDIHTSTILNALQTYNAKATFFVNGTHVSDHPDLIESIFSAHCEIGNHTNLHEMFSENTHSIIQKTVEDTNKKIRKLVGIGAVSLRPPGGDCRDRYGNAVSLGYPLIRWSIDTLDYTGKTADTILHTITTQAKHGDIVLMHDTKEVTAQVADEIIQQLQDDGFQLVTVRELLEFSKDGAVNDKIYNSAP